MPTTSPTRTGSPSSATRAAPSTSPPSPSSTARRSDALLHARPVAVPAAVLRAAAAAAFHPRLTPTPPGWVDMALAVPLMDTARAREELGWQPRRDAGDALLELLDGMRTEAGAPTPTLEPGGDGRLRSREILSGIGARGPR